MFLAGVPPFDTERDVYASLNEYLTGHGHDTYYEPDRYRQDRLVALVRTDVHAGEYPLAYATVGIEWRVRGRPGATGGDEMDVFRFEWVDAVDPAFDVEQRRRDEDPFPAASTPAVGLHRDDTHDDLGETHWQVESPGDNDPDRHEVPYALVDEPPTTVLDYFLTTAPRKLSEARDRYRE